MIRLLAMLAAAALVSGCASVYPLQEFAKHSAVRVDTASRDIGAIKRLAWAGYTVVFECDRQCPYTVEERTRLAQEIADRSFDAFDNELRNQLGDRAIQDVALTTQLESFTSAQVRTESYQSRVGQWLEKLGFTRAPLISVSARGLKTVSPNEIGWSGEETLMALGQKLHVDGVLVGQVRVRLDEEERAQNQANALVIDGPKLWLFSSHKAKSVAVAELTRQWMLERTSQGVLNWSGLSALATNFSSRFAQELL